jgi:hypothetical protein
MLLEKASQTIDSESRRRASDTATFAKVEPLLEISREAVLLEGKELAKPNALFQFYARQLDTRPNAFTRKYAIDMLKSLALVRRQNPNGMKDTDAKCQRDVVKRSSAIVKVQPCDQTAGRRICC